ncbi:MAG TPA: hypothetical protein VLQ65_06875 [Saliniramus sp.]|nr:hypothetical protein [Saliniramus sp.]
MAQTRESAGRPHAAAPAATERRSIPRWILILAGAIAVVAIISHFYRG